MIIKEHLDQIKARRTEQKNKLEQRETEFKIVKKFALQLEKLCNNPFWLAMINESAATRNAWDSLCAYLKKTDFFNKVLMLFGSDADTLERGGALKDIWERVNREFITISVMGPIASGKSTFLQLVTGFDDSVIPTAAGTCTAACTTFIHDERKVAIVEFLTEDEVKNTLVEHIELLNAHLANTNQRGEVAEIITRDAAHNLTLANLISEVSYSGYLQHRLYSEHAIAVGTVSTQGSSMGYYKTVKGFCDNYSGYSHFLGAAEMEINEEDVREGNLRRFVSYDTDGTSAAFAVRKVTLYWPLNLGDDTLGQMRLQDCMGIGEAKIGVTKNLVKTLRDESDIAIALCRVQQNQDLDTDVNTRTFIQVVKDSVDGRQPEQWVYYLLNKYADASSEDVDTTKNQLMAALAEGGVQITLPESHFADVGFLVNGVKNYAGIEEYFSSSILPDIVRNISVIDDFFVSKAKVTLDETLDAFKRIAEMFCSVPIPSFSIEHYIKNVLSDVRREYFKLLEVCAPEKDEIQVALTSYLDENPLGSFVSKSLGGDNIVDEKQSMELLPHELKAAELSKAETHVHALLEKRYTLNHYRSGYAFTYFTEVFRALEDSMGYGLECVIGQTDIVNKVADIKEKLGDLFITKGKITLNDVSAKDWLNAFTDELKQHAEEYPNLICCLETFNAKKIDLRKNVVGSVRHILHTVVSEYHVFANNEVLDYASWLQTMAHCLVHKEDRFSTIVRTEYSEKIGKEILNAQKKFITSTDEFMVGRNGLIPKTDILGTSPVFDELFKYYKNNYASIFGDEEYGKKMDAIAEAINIKVTYCK